MMKKDTLMRLKNTAKLEALISSQADYSQILKMSQLLDKQVVEAMKELNEKKSVNDE